MWKVLEEWMDFEASIIAKYGKVIQFTVKVKIVLSLLE
jgi:hypothetical protein